MIYCVTERNQLFGIISMGDIARAREEGIGRVKNMEEIQYYKRINKICKMEGGLPGVY